MLKEIELNYRKAYTELYEIIKVLSENQKEKIPKTFIENIKNNADKSHEFKYDMTKPILEQKLMIETLALVVEVYERFLAPEEEKEIWKKYDKICLNKIEEEKRKKYNVDIFKHSSCNDFTDTKSNIEQDINYNNNLNNQLAIKCKKETIFQKIIKKIKFIFQSKYK